MKYPASGGSGDFKPVEAGTYTAICDMVIDVGMQEGSDLYPKSRRQVWLRFELPTERVEFEKDSQKKIGPAVIGKMYTASMHKKANLRHDLESWRGREFSDEQAADFDVASCLGKTCVVSVTHSTGSNGKTYANITAIGKAMKGTEKLAPELPLMLYDEQHTTQYELLPEWLRKKIDEQILPEKKAPVVPASETEWDNNWSSDEPQDQYPVTTITDDDIPF